MPKQVPVNSVTRAVSALTEMILTGELPAGAPIKEVELATQLGVSRTPVREAVAQLVERGLLEKGSGRTTRVHQPSLEDLHEIYELRIVTETFLAEKAAEMIDDKTIRRVAKLEKQLRATDGDAWFDVHREFHNTIYGAAERPRFMSIALNLRDQAEPYVRLIRKLNGPLLEHEREHTEMAQAMADHDAERARELVTSHLQTTVASVNRIFSLARELMPLSNSRNTTTQPRRIS